MLNVQLVFCVAFIPILFLEQPNGLRYLRRGGDGETVLPEKGQSAENCLDMRTPPKAAVPSVRCTLCWALDEYKTH
jgi:hypothetical protein